MRVLVTGGGGFAGGHAIRDLADAGHTPICFDLHAPQGISCAEAIAGDIRDADALQSVIHRLKPDACLHLGGIAHVPMGWTDTGLVLSVNLMGTVNLLDAFRIASPQTRVLIVASAEVYGRTHRELPLTERDQMLPANPYGISKMGADLMGLLYARRYSMPVMTARSGNHIGPGQSSKFVATAFAEQLVQISLGQCDPVMKVGNLDAKRDFTDVRDVVRAYRLLLERGPVGEAYNIASGTYISIQEILDTLCAISQCTPTVEMDPERYRPADTTPAIDASKIDRDVNWKPEIPLESSLRDVLEECRDRVGAH